tara:strand:+ start:1493 stop:1831 length:339 start_codon:yes stop_codon:yes gene_type:complete
MELKFKKRELNSNVFISNEIQIKNELYIFKYSNYYEYPNHVKPWLDNGERANFVLYTYQYCIFDKEFALEDCEGFYFKTKKEMINYLKYFLHNGRMPNYYQELQNFLNEGVK